jgi:tetratricopeptide (TPR) repeat protein
MMKCAGPVCRLALAAGIFTCMLVAMAWNAPLSGDEEVHFRQAEKNLAFYRSLGADRTALDTPITHLKHYGQSFDNLTTLFIQWFGIGDAYRFRHAANALAAGFLIFITGTLVFELTSSRLAGLAAMLLLLVSPRFAGHALNNLKDIPFSLGYAVAVFALVRAGRQWPRVCWSTLALVTAGIAFAISIRVGGLLLVCYLWFYGSLHLYRSALAGAPQPGFRRMVWRTLSGMLLLSLAAYLLGLLFWPWGVTDPLRHPFESLALMHRYPTSVRQVFEGRLYWSEDFPWYYLGKYILITTPPAVLAGLAAFFLFFRKVIRSENLLPVLLTCVAAFFPLFYTSASGANVYGGWRQLLFIYPMLVGLAAAGLYFLYGWLRTRRCRAVLVVALLALTAHPVRHMLLNHPYHYVYFNPLAGGVRGAYGQYELDYYFTACREAYAWLWERLAREGESEQTLTVASSFLIREYYRGRPQVPLLIDYYHRGEYDWDYAVVCNTFLYPGQLKEGNWPPQNTIYEVKVDGRPIAAVIKRMNKLDLAAFRALQAGEPDRAAALYETVLSADPGDESALLNLARAQMAMGRSDEAGFMVDRLERVCPGNSWVAHLRAELRARAGDRKGAMALLRRNIAANKKFYQSYVELGRLYLETGQPEEAKRLLHTCLWHNPFYREANRLMGEILQAQGQQAAADAYFGRAR